MYFLVFCKHKCCALSASSADQLYETRTLLNFNNNFFFLAPGMVGVRVQGSGVLVDLYRSIIKAFKLPDMSTDLNSIPCLPEPLPPDFNRYIQISKLYNYLQTLASPIICPEIVLIHTNIFFL